MSWLGKGKRVAQAKQQVKIEREMIGWQGGLARRKERDAKTVRTERRAEIFVGDVEGEQQKKVGEFKT